MISLETSKNDEIDDNVLAKERLHGIESRMSEKTMTSNYKAMRMNDPATDKYYIF